MRGRTAPAIVHGFSKDMRPDLKQLLFILTTDAEGGVPVHFRCADGNTRPTLGHEGPTGKQDQHPVAALAAGPLPGSGFFALRYRLPAR